MPFTEDEAAYLKSQPLVRIATVGPGGQPDVTPVSFECSTGRISMSAAESQTSGPRRTVHRDGQ
jgi:pyridoxamine 5'-phosphate oxidase family protein